MERNIHIIKSYKVIISNIAYNSNSFKYNSIKKAPTLKVGAAMKRMEKIAFGQ